jgi:cytochrome c556
MRRFGLIFGSLAFAAAVTGASFAQAQAQGAVADVIAARQAGFKNMGTNFGAVKKALEAGGDLTAAAANAQVAADWARKIPTVFPVGSGPESGVKTSALPEIWANKADFDKLAANLGAEADKLVAALKANDKAAATAAFAATGGACGACHRTYRAKT